MPAGKAAAQAGHAFVGAITEALQNRPWRRQARQYLHEKPGTKVTLESSLDAIEALCDRLKSAAIPHFLVIDEGHVMPPHFDGSPIVTALGVGPLTRDQAKPFLRKFKMFGGL